MEALIVLFVIVAVIAVVGVLLYNRLVRLRNAYRNAFGQIDVQLKRRHDLVPALVETVRGYASHERETFEAVTQARNHAETSRNEAGAKADDPQAVARLGRAEGTLASVLDRLFALAEAYPDLQASDNFRELQEELTSTENRVAYARQAYNDSVMAHNNAVETVPSNLVAGQFGFALATLLDFEDRAETMQPPAVSFARR